MPTYRSFISDITSQLKVVSQDSYLPAKLVYNEAISIIGDFLKKENTLRKVYRIADGWQELQGVDLEELPTIECPDVDVTLCDKVMRSKLELPETFSYSFGNIIKHVASPNFGYFFDPVTPRQWNAIQKRKYKDKHKYYYFLIGNYLYIPVPKNVDLPIEQVRIEAYFVDKYKVDLFKAQSSCYDCKKIDLCKSPLDYDVVCPSFLINDVKKELLIRLTKIYLQVTEDTYSNMNTISKDNTKDLNNAR